jgi:hypothetical protein
LPRGVQNSKSSSEVMARLRTLADPSQLAGMVQDGIGVENALGGIRVPVLRRLAARSARIIGSRRSFGNRAFTRLGISRPWSTSRHA